MMKKSVLLILLLVLSISCSESRSTEPVKPTAPTQDDISRNNPPFLPAYETEWERQLKGKTDEYDDYRFNNSSKYYITLPPTDGDVRFPGEFEKMGHLLVGWQVGQLDDFFVEIIKGAWGKATIILMNYVTNPSAGTMSKPQMISYLKSKAPELNTDDATKIIWVETKGLDSIWARDYGPQAILHKDNTISFVDTNYYHYRVLDDKVPTELGSSLGINVFRASISQEGGNFLSDGEGNCFTTRGSLWFNLPDPDEAGHKQLYKEYFGCKNLYFPMPLDGEGTTHIDMFMMIVGPSHIVLGEYSKEDDCLQRDVLEANYELLKSIKDKDGKQKYTIYRIPMPPADDGIWRTYTNMQIVRSNLDDTGSVLVPVYTEYKNQKQPSLFKGYEDKAMEVLAKAFKEAHPTVTWTFHKINSDDIIPGNGAIHCVVKEIPAGTLKKYQDNPADKCGLKKSRCVTVTGCGTITGVGYCDGNNEVYCQDGQVYSYPCGIPCNQVNQGPCEQSCGEVTGRGGNYFGCTGKKYVCEGTAPTCSDDCSVGQTGCSADGTKKWSCGEAGDDDTCREKVEENCQQGQICLGGTCVSDACNDVTAAGKCEGNTLVVCDNGKLKVDNCSDKSAACTWSETDKKNICKVEQQGCTDECQPNTQGCDANNAWVCQKPLGLNCFAKVIQSCGSSTCTNGACCNNECQLGDKGCTDNTTSWVCQADRLGCMVKTSTTCQLGATCGAGTCQVGCTNECQEGQVGCGDDGKSTWKCQKLAGSECFSKVATPCITDFICTSGNCHDPNVTPTPQTDGGTDGTGGKSGSCSVNHSSSNSPLALLLLFAGMFGFILRRRVHG